MRNDAIFNPLEEYLGKRSKEFAEYKAFYPSEASCRVGDKIIGGCNRKLYWRFKGEEVSEGKSYKMYLAARLGDKCEETFLDLYKRQGLLRASQFSIRHTICGINISGRGDGITKKGQLIEVKSAYGTAFFNSVNLGPKLEHLVQILIYMCITGLKECLLPYICRDNASKRAGYLITKKEIEAQGITMAGILRRWIDVKKALALGIVPPCDFPATSWQCGYCVYKTKCYTEEEMIKPPKEKKPRKSKTPATTESQE